MKFSEWFEIQARPRPSDSSRMELLQNVNKARENLKMAEAVLEEVDTWTACREFALRAWNISEEDKK